MRGFGSTRVRGGLLCLVAVWCSLPLAGTAAEIANFRLTDFSAYLETKTRYDKETTPSLDNEFSQSELVFAREVGLSTRSYIYHPNMLVMNLAGGLFSNQRSFTTESATISTTEKSLDFTWNIATTLNFLNNKPYPFSLFYNRNNTLQPIGETGTLTRTNTNFGFNLSLLQSLVPVPVRIKASRSLDTGENQDRIIDETFDRVTVTATHSFLEGLNMRLDYMLTHEETRNGNPNTPIQETSYIDNNVQFNSRWVFGNNDKYEFVNTAFLRTRDDPENFNASFAPSFRWKHSRKMSSHYRYSFATSSAGEFESTHNSGGASLQFSPIEQMTSNVEVHGAMSDVSQGSQSNRYGASARASYGRPIPFGELGLSASLRYDIIDLSSNIDQIDIIDESIVLTGLTSVTLRREFVIPGTVVVTDDTGGITYTEGTDYLLTVAGSNTQLVRIVTGIIPDPDTVLVDYAYEPGGIVNFSQMGYNMAASYSFARYYSMFARFSGSSLSVNSGRRTTPLNPKSAFEMGASAAVPLWRGITVGGNARFTHQEEDIAPFDSMTYDAYMKIPLPFRSNLAISGSMSQTDYQDSINNSDTTGFSATLQSTPWHRLHVSATATYEERTGGTIESSFSEGILLASWQKRKLRISAEASYRTDTQGTFTRDRLRAMLFVRRNLW